MVHTRDIMLLRCRPAAQPLCHCSRTLHSQPRASTARRPCQAHACRTYGAALPGRPPWRRATTGPSGAPLMPRDAGRRPPHAHGLQLHHVARGHAVRLCAPGGGQQAVRQRVGQRRTSSPGTTRRSGHPPQGQHSARRNRVPPTPTPVAPDLCGFWPANTKHTDCTIHSQHSSPPAPLQPQLSSPPAALSAHMLPTASHGVRAGRAGARRSSPPCQSRGAYAWRARAGSMRPRRTRQ